jgi:hypothetical protein
MDMTKRTVKAALGLEHDSELASLFDITAQAVHQWADDEPIPDLRQLQLQVAFPRKFGKPRGASTKVA